MNCPACASTLMPSTSGAHARCTGCDRLYTLPSMQAVVVPSGVDPLAFSETLGFNPPAQALPPDPMQAMKNAFAHRAANMGVKMDVGGVRIGLNKDGIGVNTRTLERDLKHKAEQKVWQWVLGCVGTVLVGALVLGGFAVVGGIVFFQVLSHDAGGGGKAAVATSWNGAAPFTCGANDNVTISGVTANLPGKTAIKAGGNCQLTLSDVDASGAVALDVGGNAVVTISGGRLAGTDQAVKVGANGSVIGSGVKVEGEVKTSGSGTVNGL